MLPLLWPPNSPYLNPVDQSVWEMLQDKVYKTCMTNLDGLKHRIRTEWAKLDHAVIAASVHHWRRRLSRCVNAGGGHFEHCFWFKHCVFSNNVTITSSLRSVMQVLMGHFTFFQSHGIRIVRMIRAKNYKKLSKFVEVTATILSVPVFRTRCIWYLKGVLVTETHM